MMSESANTRIIKNTFFLYIRMFFILAVSLYTSREILIILGAEDFGIYSVVAGFISLFTFLNFSMSNATQRFIAFEIGRSDQIRLKKIFDSSLFIYICLAIIIVIIAETIGLWFLYNKISIPEERFASALWVYQFSILTLVIQTIQIPFNALIIARERMNIYTFLSLIEIILKLSIVYVLLISSMDKLVIYSILIFIVSVFIAISYISFCCLRFKESHFKFSFEKNIYKELISYSSWSLFGNVAAVAKGQGINVLLNIFFGPIVNAAYGIMLQVQSAVSLFSNNFLLAINPQIIKSYSTNETERYIALIKKGSRYSFLLVSILILPLIYNINFVLTVWLKSVPEYTSDFVVLCLVCLQIESLSGTLMTGIQATGKIKLYQFVVGLVLFANLPLSYLFLRLNFSPSYVFIVAIILAVISLFFRLFFLKKLVSFRVNLFIKEVIGRIIVTLVTINLILLGINNQLSVSNNYLGLNLAKLAFSFCITIFVVFLLGLEKQERLVLISYIKLRTKNK